MMQNLTLASCRLAFASGMLTLASSIVAWAATEAPRDTMLWSGEDQWVKIERQDSPSASPNDHPASLGAANVANALAALRIRVVDADTGAETQRAVFTREELGNLAPPVAMGLAKAGPQQDVTFSTVASRPLAGLVKGVSVNSGRIFYEDGKLNVIFGELQASYRKKNIYGQRDQDFDARRQGAREQASKQKWALYTSPGIALHATAGNNLRSDWVMIDPEIAAKAAPPAVAASSTRQANEPPASVTAPAAHEPPEPPTSVVAQPAREPPASATPPAPDADAKLERRLQALKDLKSKGLISEEAYNAKVQELLSEL